jgi:FkbM family methyltransferase
MNRRDFLVGNAVGLGVGVAGGIVGVRAWGADHTAPAAPVGSASSATPATSVASVVDAAAPVAKELEHMKMSFAQQGEDLILDNIFDIFKLAKPDYIDVGAFDPFIGSNTYLFYRSGSRGVLVEPNPAQVEKLKAGRPGDTVVAAGIGTGKEKEADYWIFQGDGQLNTFSKEQADGWIKQYGEGFVKQKVKMPLLDINDVLKQHFQQAPTLFSIDTEGLDYGILKSLDFDKWRPKVFCVETAMPDSWAIHPQIVALLTSKGYVARGMNMINSMFVDKKLMGG